MGYHVDERRRRTVQATLEAVDGSRLGGFFVQVVPLGDCSGKREFLYAAVDAKMHLNLYRWVTSIT